MKEKEIWIDETMDALEGIQQAKANPNLMRSLEAEIHKPAPTFQRIRPAVLWPIAATIAVLVSMNILSAVYYTQSYPSAQETTDAVVSEYLYYLGPIKL
jgi:hypothetical protein